MKACPFCGGNRIYIANNCEYDCWYVACSDCSGMVSKSFCHLPELNYDENEVDIDSIEEDATNDFMDGKIKGLEPLVKAWNTRANERSG